MVFSAEKVARRESERSTRTQEKHHILYKDMRRSGLVAMDFGLGCRRRRRATAVQPTGELITTTDIPTLRLGERIPRTTLRNLRRSTSERELSRLFDKMALRCGRRSDV